MLKQLDMSKICFVIKEIQLLQFIEQQKSGLKSGYQLKLILLYKTVRNILYYSSTVHVSRNVQD